VTTDMRQRDAVRLLAVQVLLEQPEDIPDTLEAELYAYRDNISAGPQDRALCCHGGVRPLCGPHAVP
jgi:hypothetical protein